MLYLGADHAGFPLKEELKKFLTKEGYEVIDVGHDQLDLSDDYPDFARAVALSVAEEESAGGILICGTGQGMCIAANRVAGVRAALIYDDFTARAAAEHLNANIACLGARTTDEETAKKLIKIWLETDFSGEERHVRRLAKIEEREE